MEAHSIVSDRRALGASKSLHYVAPLAPQQSAQKLLHNAHCYGLLRSLTLQSSALFTDPLIYFEHKIEIENYESYVPERTAFYADPRYARVQTNGLQQIERLEALLHEVCPTRSPWQIKLHQECIRATLVQTLGSDYDALVDRVCLERGWRDGPKQELLVLASRRSGKTFGIALFAACLAMCVPSVDIVIFSLSLRQSQKMLALIVGFVMRLEQGRKMVTRVSQDRLLLKGPNGAQDIRSVLSYPGRSEVSFCVCVCSIKRPGLVYYVVLRDKPL
jgi:hypothetical protein